MITNEDKPEVDDIFDPEEFDNYINMEIALDKHDDGPEFSKFNKRLKEKDGRLIGIAADNPILDTWMYEVEYADGHKTAMTANEIASNLFSQVDQDEQRFLLFNAIIDLQTDGTQINEGEALSIFPMETRGGEIPPKYGKFSYNGNIGVLLRIKLRTSRSSSRYN